MEMEGDVAREKPTTTRGGKRRGAGRKRLHEEGYESFRGLIWKTILLHDYVFEDWVKERRRFGFALNNDFPMFLFDKVKWQQGPVDSWAEHFQTQ